QCARAGKRRGACGGPGIAALRPRRCPPRASPRSPRPPHPPRRKRPPCRRRIAVRNRRRLRAPEDHRTARGIGLEPDSGTGGSADSVINAEQKNQAPEHRDSKKIGGLINSNIRRSLWSRLVRSAHTAIASRDRRKRWMPPISVFSFGKFDRMPSQDSLDAVELVMAFEEAFGERIPDRPLNEAEYEARSAN